MKKTVALVLALSLFFITACGNGGEKEPKRVLNVCSWGEYIDTDLIYQFERETGIKVNYDTAESNEALYARLKTGGTHYDVITPSDYMISQLIDEGLLQPLDYAKIPNFSLIGDQFLNLPYDPNNEYTVPYAWGTLGIIYNPNLTKTEITSWDAMFDPQYAGNVLMIRNPRDAIAIALMSLGYSVNTTDENEIQKAYEKLATAKSQGVYQAFVMDEVFDKMEAGEAAISAYYAGDYVSMWENNPDLRFVLPESGGNWFVDGMCILKDAEHVSEAEEWINFLCSTQAGLANMDFIYYASPNTEVLAQYPNYAEDVDTQMLSIMAPSDADIAHCEMYLTLPKEILSLYSTLWTQLGI